MKVYNLIKKDGMKYIVHGLVVEIENNTKPNLPSKKYYLLTWDDKKDELESSVEYKFVRIGSIGNFTEAMEKDSFFYKEIIDQKYFTQCAFIISSCLEKCKYLSSSKAIEDETNPFDEPLTPNHVNENEIKNDSLDYYELEKIDYDLLDEEIKCLHPAKL